MVFFTEYKSSIGKKWPTYVCSVLFGITMSMMGLSILGLTTHGTVFTLSIKFGFVVFIIFALAYNYFLIKYRKNKSEIYISNFQGDTIKLQRDRRINQIIGNIFS
jgi:membrane protein implicated in regulation of membrane protease activity